MLPLVRLSALALTALPLSALPVASPAQTPAGALITLVMPAGEFGSDKFTDVIVNTLGAAQQFCGAVDQAYRVDCLAERLGNMANGIPSGTDYAEVKEILNAASRDMSSLVNANRDAARPRQNVRTAGAGAQSTTRPLTPIRQTSLAQVSADAAAILDRTETILLRSPDDEGGKKQHYARIASALGSNKTLLRSG